MSPEALACPTCGADARETDRFCSQCGRRLVDDDPGDAGTSTPTHLYGVLTPGPTFVLGVVLLLGGVVALATGRFVAAVLLLGFAVASFAFFRGAAQRDPSSPLVRGVTNSWRRLLAWAVFAWRSIEAWVGAGRAIVRIDGESRALRRARESSIRSFGDAAYREDTALAEELRLRLHEIDEALAARARQREESIAKARQRVDEEHVAARPTQQFVASDLHTDTESDA
jgi:hypothetical protein